MLIIQPAQRQTRHCWYVGCAPEYIYLTHVHTARRKGVGEWSVETNIGASPTDLLWLKSVTRTLNSRCGWEKQRYSFHCYAKM